MWCAMSLQFTQIKKFLADVQIFCSVRMMCFSETDADEHNFSNILKIFTATAASEANSE